ncbi:FG-GAP-like repeat-containing protein, partial [Flavobacteriaceae bacterium]|nr:FG-GAP-like repeat-containing protein [Flavobacteriaceae bacterium]
WIRDQFITRGYLSNVSPVIHFGLGNRKTIDSLIIRWADGKTEKRTNVATNNTVTLRHSDAKKVQKKSVPNTPTLFKQIQNPFDHKDQKAKVLDFNRQKLLHYQPSFTGPAMTTTDLNNDGLKDIIIGGGQNQTTSVWLQGRKGNFNKKEIQAFAAFKNYVDTAVTPIDVNNDGFMDLYISSGGYHDLPPGDTKLQDRIYLNNGQADFKYAPNALPENLAVTSIVKATDVNMDGATDLFVGGGIVPGAYPERYNNLLLINNGEGRFENQTQNNMAAFQNHPGIVRDAIWTDFNNDQWPDLLVVGEWMAPTLLINQKGKLEINNDKLPINLQSGWYNTVESWDFNADGFPDYVLGNEGLNTQYQIDEDSPVEIVYGDFDNNESVDPIIQYEIKGTAYPMAPRDEILNQLTYLKSKYPSYRSYSDQTVEDIFTPKQLKDAKTLSARGMETGILLSQPEGNYEFKPLSGSAQFSPVCKIVIDDFNKDGDMDLLLAGNRTKMAIKLGRYDTNRGFVYFGNGKGTFEEVPQRFTGLSLEGDVRGAVKINGMWLFGIHGESLKTYRLSK